MDVALPLTRPRRTTSDDIDADDLTARGRALVTRASTFRAGVTFRLAGVWAHVDIAGTQLPEQGWKLHISATEASAAEVLAAVVPVLVAQRASFKFAATRSVVRVLNSATVDRGSGGKFLTVYPVDDHAAAALADACHEATRGLAGPVILSDRPYRPGSLVHYRYGGFADRHAIDSDGMVVYLIRDPNGNLIPDERRPGQASPPWAADPFQPHVTSGTPAPTPGAAPAGGPVLLNDRYVVRSALRHANKGGTYLADDRLRAVPVVIKEGRPHVAGSADGDAGTRIRHEAAMLTRLGAAGCGPGLVEVFEQGGHTFLVEECVPAPTLREVVEDAFDPPGGGIAAPELAEMAVRLAAAMDRAHAAGVILRDFNPNNILVGPDGDVTLIDLEFAYEAGHPPATPAGTPGYSSPEQLRGQPTGAADDYWSLGATLAFVATGSDPYFPTETAHTWSDTDRLGVWLARLVVSGRIETRMSDLISGCMAARPGDRLGPAAVVPALTTEPGLVSAPRSGSGPAAAPGPAQPAQEFPVPAQPAQEFPVPAQPAQEFPVPAQPAQEFPVPDPAGITAWLLSTMGAGSGSHAWPAGPTGMALDPANVQSGASGVGLYLCHAARTSDRASRPNGTRSSADAALAAAVAATAAWVSDRIARGPQRTPGLHFGLSGMAWFLTEASETLGRDDLARRARELSLSLPVRSPNPDFSHGTAGIGLGQLHQYLRSGDERFLARANLAAEHLALTVEGDLTWRVPAEAPTRLAGTTSYGFAHGTAGIATFLLYAGAATGESRFTTLGLEALAALAALAVVTADGAAFWPIGPDNDELWPHWCNGSSGVGTAMLRAWAVDGGRRFLGAAEAAALAGLREAWRSSPVQCHGLAGDAELLLDLADFSPDPRSADRWVALATDAAQSLWVRRRVDGSHVVFADDTGGSVSAGLGTGVAGVGAFLLRLRHRDRRYLMLDELLDSR